MNYPASDDETEIVAVVKQNLHNLLLRWLAVNLHKVKGDKIQTNCQASTGG
jgi:hypothetical protein